jgi:hypothetical protein
MQGVEFDQYFEKFPALKKCFTGVYSIDTLPKHLKYRTFCISNTDTHDGFGKHWICFLKAEKSSLECFDSLGISSEKKDLLVKYCRFKAKALHFNYNQFQKSDSISCGLFCIYFIIQRSESCNIK